MATISRKKRYAARTILHVQGVLFQVGLHELWRLVNVEKEGLTSGELKFAQQRVDMIKRCTDDLNKLGIRIQGTL